MKQLSRIIWNLLAITGFLSIVVTLFMWQLEDKFDLASGIEMSRLSSPHNEYDAVIIKYEPMAFSTPSYSLFIVPHGEKYSVSSSHFRHSNFRGVGIKTKNILWEDDRNLVIKHWSRASISQFEPVYYDLMKPIERDTHTDYQKVYIDLITI